MCEYMCGYDCVYECMCVFLCVMCDCECVCVCLSEAGSSVTTNDSFSLTSKFPRKGLIDPYLI